MVGFNKNDTLTSTQKLIAGVVSGVVTRFITQPLDVVKLRSQVVAKKKPKSTQWFKVSRRILREEGIHAFFQGHTLGQVHSILAVSSQFYVFELATKFFSGADSKNEYQNIIYFISGIVAGCSSATLVLPIEVVRVRQMLVKDQYKGLINGALKVYKTGGILAFYEGLTASLMQMGPQVGISFMTFAVAQPIILNWLHTFDSKEAPSNKVVSKNLHRPEQLVLASTIAGITSGFVAKTLTYPFDLAKRRMQINTHVDDTRYQTTTTERQLIRCHTLGACIIDTYQKEGVRGLFRGWKVTVYKAQISSMLAFTTYEMVCYLLRNV